MARRFGGKYSPDTDAPPQTGHARRIDVDPVGGRANVMFIPPVILMLTTFASGASSLALGLIGAGIWTLGAWLLRGGLRAEAAFAERKVARAPSIPRKSFAGVLAGIGAALAAFAHQESGAILTPLVFGICTSALHFAAFGFDPMRSKGMEGVDTFQQDRVARVVDKAEDHLSAMTDAMQRANDRIAEERLEKFKTTARDLIRTVEEDPRDLSAARKYLGVYLQGARDATIKFADIQSRTGDAKAREDYLTLLKDLDENFAARTRKLLIEDRTDLTVEIDVLRERLSREGVRLPTLNEEN